MLLGLLAAPPAWAAADAYRLYIDSDASAATGCSASLTDRNGSASVGGFDYRITVAVDAAGNASQPTVAACQGSDFGADTPIGQAAAQAVTRASGAASLAELEFMLPASAVAATPSSVIVLASNGDYIRYARFNASTPATLTPISGLSVLPPGAGSAAPIPAVAPALLGALALLLAALAVVLLRKRALHPMLALLLLIAFMGSSLAAGILAIDGNTDDWQGISPVAIDLTGDQVPGANDLYSLAAQFQEQNLYLRIDTVAGPNPLRDLSPLEAASAQPRFASQPTLNLSVGQSWTYAVQASSAGGQALTAAVTQAPAGLQTSGSAPNQQLTWTPTAAGAYWVNLQIQDGAATQTQKFLLYVSDDSSLPPDPASAATALAPVGFTSFADRTAFLYQGAAPVQTGVASGAIDPVTATVVRGKVLDSQGNPLPGVTVSIAGHPEWGQTKTRADGAFDQAAGGGGWLTIDYQKPGYMRVQRRIQAPWRDYAYAPNVVLLPYDRQYSAIDLSANTAQLYWGAAIDDGRGARRASVYFPAGTQASMVMPDGSTQPLAKFTMRASEYTLGAGGPQSMPAGLPMSVGYTWAANFTADEAEAAGAQSIQFSKPVVTYVDNFINMPVGTAVPVGWYDFDKTAWIGEDNGRIIKILSVDAQGQAVLQVGVTDGEAASADQLQALGIDADELKQLASTRAVGSVLWRVAMTHFTPRDCNWPYGPTPGAVPPPDQSPDQSPLPPQPNQCTPTGQGCDVFFSQRALGQGIDLPGTPLSLYYRSDRVDMGPRTIQVRLTDASPPPASLPLIQATVQIAGTTQTQSHTGWSANETANFIWDGRDNYGRLQPNGATAQITVSYVYPAIYYAVSADFDRAWDELQANIGDTGASVVSDTAALTITVSRSYTRYIARVNQPSPELGLAGAGNWALRGLRMYDAETNRVYETGGDIWTATQQPRRFAAITNAAVPGTPTKGASAIGADGALYYSDTSANQIRRVWLYGARKGEVDTLAGTGAAGYSGDGGPATAAQLNQPTALALAPDGSVIFGDYGNARLRRIDAAGTIQTVADNIYTYRIAVAGDMTIFVEQGVGSLSRLLQISPDGHINNTLNVNGESFSDLASAPTGQVWLITSGGLYQFTDIGTLRKMASTASTSAVPGLMADAQGGAYFYDANNAFSYISRAGDITSLGQNFADSYSGSMLGVAPGGDLIAAVYSNSSSPRGYLVGTLGAGLPAFGDAAYRIARSDGNAIDEFDLQGRPIATRSTFGGQTLLTYQYAPTGQLSAITDSYGNTTTLARDASGLLTSVTGPFGQSTSLSYNGNGQLTGVVQPGGLQYAMQYASPSLALMTRYQDPRGNVDQFSYDADGLLTSNTDPIGGGWRLSGTGSIDDWTGVGSYTVSAQSAEGRTSTYATTGSMTSSTIVTTAPDGTQSTSLMASGQYLTKTQPNGAVNTTTLRTDPRLGGAVIPSPSISLASGYGVSMVTNRYLSNTYDADAWENPQNWTERTTLNNYYSWNTRYQSPGLFTQTSPMDRATSVQLDAHQQPVSASLPSGLQLSYSYNSAGQVTGISSTDGTTTRTASLSWNASGPGGGQIASVTNALGQSARFAYDAAGRPSSLTLPDGRSLNYQWDATGNLSSLSTPAGVVHSFNYNGVQLPTGYTPQGGAATQWNYDRDRLLTSIARPGGQTLTVQRAASGRVTALVDSVSGATQLSYDSAGRVASATGPDGQSISYGYNGALLQNIGLRLQAGTASLTVGYEVAPSIASTSTKYINARLGQVTLTAGGVTQSIAATYDGDGMLTKNGPLQLGYNYGSGQLTSRVVGKLVTSEQSDAWGQESSSQTYVQQSGFDFNQENNRQAVYALVSALGAQLSSNISGRGDCTTWLPTDTLVCNYASPQKSRTANISAQHAANHATAKISVVAVPPSCTPTDAEQAAQYGLPWPPQPPQWSSTDTCQQSLQSQIEVLLQTVDSTSSPAFISSLLQSLVSSFSQGPIRFVTASQMITGVPSTFNTSYIDSDAQVLIDQINATLANWQANQSNWNVALAQSHTRDALGRITQTQETLLGASVPNPRSYQYDQSGRLISATVDGLTTSWGYDANGNRTQENGSTIASYDNEDRLQSWKNNSYAYNAAGDLASKTTLTGTSSYSYDTQGNLRSVSLPDGKNISYAIDPLGRRTGKSINGALQWQLVWLSSLKPLARLNADGTLDETYYYGDKPNVPEAMSKGTSTYRIISDQNGSVRLVIDANTGAVAQQIDYDVWGNVINDTNPGFQPFGFAGGLYDSDTKLTRFGARDYDAETGRWTAKDPILFNGGDSNLYGYVFGDPVNNIDFSGWAKDGEPLTLENCQSLNKLIEFEKSYGKILTLLKYNPLNFGDYYVSLDAAYPSVGGPVSIDWMLRSGSASEASLAPNVLGSRAVYIGGKLLNNSLNRNNPFTNLTGEANWNAPSAFEFWFSNDDMTIEKMFAPALQECKCKE